MAISYPAISHAEDDVVGALQREGGVLSYPELVTATRLPYDLVSRILDRLKSEHRVEISTLGDASSGVRLVRLARPSSARFATLLGI